MAEERDVTEEARRVADALRAIEEMDDPAQQARAITEVLKAQSESAPTLKEKRRKWVLQRRGAKVTYREIAEELGVSISTVQDIERGYSGSGKTRPRTGRRKRADSDGADGAEQAGGGVSPE
ncbi:sigma factor-like helix-turn-helix DNA-binding protein [Streptomyces sp. NPDC006334]|uniref:sigma factor-like helix-turn-helix DNA-binding protein n=1 Tax=Streptomyces sp. NPDC006334 TaxID=3156754 RepID=UPI0033AEE95C